MIEIDVNDDGIKEALKRVLAVSESPRGILEAIGEVLIASTKARFGSSTGPDGQKWAPNSQVTILQYLSKRSGSAKNRGSASPSKKPLIGESRLLSQTITKQIEGNDTLLIGSPMVYASAQQFGMKRGFAGTNRRGSPIPWGDIPPRPFLGISKDDRTNILSLIAEQMMASPG